MLRRNDKTKSNNHSKWPPPKKKTHYTSSFVMLFNLRLWKPLTRDEALFQPATCSMVQKMWASSCWKRRTLVSPVSVPDSSLRWRTPKSASLRGSSRHDRGRWLNIRLGQAPELKVMKRRKRKTKTREEDWSENKWSFCIFKAPLQHTHFRCKILLEYLNINHM